MLDVNWNPSRRDLRLFGVLWLPLFAAAVGYWILRASGAWTVPLVIWSVAAVAALVGFAAPQRLKPFVVAWMAAAYPIGWTISHLVLGITYFVLFTIFGLTLRLVGYDPLNRKPVPGRSSYWQRRETGRPAASYFKQF